MKAPKTSADITKEWLEYIFTAYERKTCPHAKVQLESYTLDNGGKVGEGYTSVLIKLDAKATILNEEINEDTSGSRKHQYHVVIKFGSQDSFKKVSYDVWRLNQRELLMYSHVIDELNEYQFLKTSNEFRINMPKLIYGKYSDKNYVLVIENLKEDNFDINPLDKLLNLEQAKAALSQLARLHAISYVYNKSTNIVEKFPIYKTNNNFSSILYYGNTVFYEIIIDYLKTKKDMEHILIKVEAKKSFLLNECKKLLKDSDGCYITCLNHGDIWNNNILFKNCTHEGNHENGSYKTCLIDWQLTHWGTPAYDLHHFMAGSTTPDLRKEHLTDLLQHYHGCFTEIINRLGSPVPNCGYDELKREYDRLYALGFLKKIGYAFMLSSGFYNSMRRDKNGTSNPFLKLGQIAMATILMSPRMCGDVGDPGDVPG